MSGSFLLETLSAARDLGRLHEIASILIRHGWGDAIRRLGIADALARAGRALHFKYNPSPTKTPQQHVREALEELGPTWVKIGQILAGRRDLLPPEWVNELAQLQECASPVPIAEIRAQLTEDLGRAPEDVFVDFDPQPLAAASIAQIHRAQLQNGDEVVLKVRRPGIKKNIAADMRLFARIAELAEHELPSIRRYRPRSLVRQISRSLKLELNLRNEARNAVRIANSLGPDSQIVVPKVYEQWTSERLCVMEYLEGPSLGSWLLDPSLTDMNPKLAARIGADAVLESVFMNGFFHADPHPGNILVLANHQLALLDFGMVGSLTDWRRIEFLELLAAFAQHDDDEVVDILLDWSEDGSTQPNGLRSDVSAFIDRYANLPLREIDMSDLLAEITQLLRDHNLFLPDDIALLLKVFITLDGMGRQLDPEFVTTAHVEPFVRQALLEHHSPRATLRRTSQLAGRMLTRMPRTLQRAMAQVRKGKLGVEVDVAELSRFGDQITRSANRVTIGLITAALIVGTSISMTTASGPQAAAIPVLGLLGFISSVAAGAWLLASIFRSR
jgi:ubiquinone biosynthesis protein